MIYRSVGEGSLTGAEITPTAASPEPTPPRMTAHGSWEPGPHCTASKQLSMGEGHDFFRQLVWSECLPGSWAGLCLFQTAQMVCFFQVAWLVLARSRQLSLSKECFPHRTDCFVSPWNILCPNKLPSKMEGFNLMETAPGHPTSHSPSLPCILPSWFSRKSLVSLTGFSVCFLEALTWHSLPGPFIGPCLATLGRAHVWGLYS